MKKQNRSTETEIPDEERSAIEHLGGFEHVESMVNGILKQHGFLRRMFTEQERAPFLDGDNAVRTEIVFNFDTGKSLRANIADLLRQAHEVQAHGGGTNYVGAMLQHLVGAKLDLVVGAGKIAHHGFSVADHSTDRKGDFHVESVAMHVTTHPGEALIRKCGDNLRDGLKPVIVTIGENVTAAAVLLKNAELGDRVDVLDALQFLTANVFEHSKFSAAQCKVTLANILTRYNAIVSECETDPSLRVRLPD